MEGVCSRRSAGVIYEASLRPWVLLWRVGLPVVRRDPGARGRWRAGVCVAVSAPLWAAAGSLLC